jgi:hypothetical protein
VVLGVEAGDDGVVVREGEHRKRRYQPGGSHAPAASAFRFGAAGDRCSPSASRRTR